MIQYFCKCTMNEMIFIKDCSFGSSDLNFLNFTKIMEYSKNKELQEKPNLELLKKQV